MTIELTFVPINQGALDKSKMKVIEQPPQESSMPTVDAPLDDVVEYY